MADVGLEFEGGKVGTILDGALVEGEIAGRSVGTALGI